MRWLRSYNASSLAGDATAGLIVTVMLIPQSLAYAMLAGLPPQAGLYASILPLVAYAALGSSTTLAVGPVAVISLMTAAALAPLAPAGSPEYAAAAVLLAFLSGLFLLAFAALRLGFIAQFLSHPVIAGFISGSAILIVLGQLKHVVGNAPTTAIGLGTIAFLAAARAWVPGLAGKLAPMAAIIVATALTALFGFDVKVVGSVPQGLPRLVLPEMKWLAELWMPALLISLVGFVESVSVARSLGARRGERIAPNRELAGLGAANVASALSGGFPVTGGFARSVVNFDAGARTPLAGVISAVLMAAALLGLTGLLHSLPHAVLAATIIVAVSSLIDWQALRETWRYDRADTLAFLATAAGVLALGVEAGVLAGVAISLGMIVWRASRPHIAVLGRVPGTEHFRNVKRHAVETRPELLVLRIDESLFFGNAAAVRDEIERLAAKEPRLRRVLLVLSAVNHIDATALAMLDEVERELAARGVSLCLAEVKGPVMDRLARTELGARMKERVYLSTHQAFQA
ncbi:MAG TPA: SulP family inorganic anion transporter [Burkholderiales bacterium]